MYCWHLQTPHSWDAKRLQYRMHHEMNQPTPPLKIGSKIGYFIEFRALKLETSLLALKPSLWSQMNSQSDLRKSATVYSYPIVQISFLPNTSCLGTFKPAMLNTNIWFLKCWISAECMNLIWNYIARISPLYNLSFVLQTNYLYL